MSRPPVIPAEKKIRIVLSVLQGEVSIAEAARREKVSEQAIGNWKRQFLEGGKAGIEAGKSKPTSREPRNAATSLQIARQTRHKDLASIGIYTRIEDAWEENAATQLPL